MLIRPNKRARQPVGWDCESLRATPDTGADPLARLGQPITATNIQASRSLGIRDGIYEYLLGPRRRPTGQQYGHSIHT